MPEISQRAELMPASPIRKLVPLAEAARARGTKIYHLNIGQPDLPSPQTGLDALKKIDRTVLEYSPSDGYRSLREKLVGTTNSSRSSSRPTTSSSRRRFRGRVVPPSCRASTPATKIIVPSEIQSLAGLAASFKGLLEDEKK